MNKSVAGDFNYLTTHSPAPQDSSELSEQVVKYKKREETSIVSQS